MKFSKKILQIAAVTVFAVLIFNFAPMEKVSAQVVTTNEVTSVPQTISLFEQITRWLKEDLTKGMRDAVAKRIIDYIVDQTVQYIQGGGRPLFVRDWNAFLKNAGAIAFDSVIKDVGLAGLCAPFKLQVRFALLPEKKFQQRIECTLDKIVSNIENFYGDFKNGSWLAYTESLQPQNNIYGQLLIADDEIKARVNRAVNNKQNEAVASSGFLAVKKCVLYDEAAVAGCKAAYGNDDPACVKENNPQYCLKYDTMTPGDAVGKTVAAAITSDTYWAANIQSWTSAIVNAAINRVFKEGLALATGQDPETFYPPEYQSLLAGELDQQKQGLADTIQRYVDDWKLRRTSKENSLSYANQIVTKLPEVISSQETKIEHGTCVPSTGYASKESLTALLNKYKTDLDLVEGLTFRNMLSEKEIPELTSAIGKGITAKDNIIGLTVSDQNAAQTLYQNFLNDQLTKNLGGPTSNGKQNAELQESELLVLLTKINNYLPNKDDSTVCLAAL